MNDSCCARALNLGGRVVSARAASIFVVGSMEFRAMSTGWGGRGRGRGSGGGCRWLDLGMRVGGSHVRRGVGW